MHKRMPSRRAASLPCRVPRARPRPHTCYDLCTWLAFAAPKSPGQRRSRLLRTHSTAPPGGTRWRRLPGARRLPARPRPRGLAAAAPGTSASRAGRWRRSWRAWCSGCGSCAGSRLMCIGQNKARRESVCRSHKAGAARRRQRKSIVMDDTLSRGNARNQREATTAAFATSGITMEAT